MKTGIRIALLAGLLVGGIGLWRLLFPGDEVVIRRQLEDLARAASFAADETPLIKLTHAGKVAGYFAASAEIDLNIWNYGRVKINGRDEVRQAALAARNAVTSLSVSVDNIDVVLGPAKDQATVRFTLSGAANRSRPPQSQQMQLEFRKIDGSWLIRHAATFEYLTP